MPQEQQLQGWPVVTQMPEVQGVGHTTRRGGPTGTISHSSQQLLQVSVPLLVDCLPHCQDWHMPAAACMNGTHNDFLLEKQFFSFTCYKSVMQGQQAHAHGPHSAFT
jgi:hypothetical protein